MNMPTAAESVLNCQMVRKAFGARQALDGVNLKIGAGEFVALLGPNGAGKSTLLQILTGLFVADSGSVEVLGADMRRAPTQALGRLGVVFQQQALDLDLSVEANLRFHARLHGLGKADTAERITDLLARVGLTEQRQTPARALSGGNRRKIELIRALLHRPALLLMDEATVGLDPAARQQILEEVLRLTHEDGMAVLWATHLVPEAERASRIVVLHQGQIQHDGSAAALCATQAVETLEQAFLNLTAKARPSPPQRMVA